jgi:ribosomal subunit interface protein
VFDRWKLEGLQLTDAVKNYVEEKVGNAVHNHGNLVKEVDVRMSVRGGETGRGQKLQRCEVTLFTKKHGVVRAEEETDNMYASIDRVSDVISRKLRKIKEKDGGHGRTPRMRNQPRIGELLSDEVVDLAPILEKKVDELPDEVVRTKYFEMRPMTSFQALEEMVNVGHDFYAFRNAESGEVNILYKRHHGGYGMIIPRSDESWELGQNGATKDKSSQ